MPLRTGRSSEVVSENIATLIREGYPRDQAAAIAYREAGRGGRGGASVVGEVLLAVQRLQRSGWSPEGALKAATFAIEARGGKGGRKARGRGVPSPQEAAALDIPLTRWASALLGGRGEIGVRVPESPQRTNYTCGPAALRGALSAFGVGSEEDELAALAKTSAAGGTSVHGLADAAEHFGFEAEVFEHMSVDDLAEHLAQGDVVIACIQAGDDETDFDSSHWVVPCAIRDDAAGIVIECMDPSVENARSVATIEEFADRWHCVDMGERVEGLALVIRGDSPANMTAIEQPATPI